MSWLWRHRWAGPEQLAHGKLVQLWLGQLEPATCLPGDTLLAAGGNGTGAAASCEEGEPAGQVYTQFPAAQVTEIAGADTWRCCGVR